MLWPVLASPVAGQDRPQMAARAITRTVDVDGVAIRVRTIGFDSRKPGQPAVVFEGGASAPLETWDESQVRRLRTWVRKGGTFEVAANSGHSIHVDDPDRVVAAVRDLVARGTR